MYSQNEDTGGSAVAGADRSLVQTLEKNLLARLQDSLPEIVHQTVASAIIIASQPKQSKANRLARPAAGGRCARVWDILDQMKSAGSVPTLKQVKKVARRRRLNENNARIEYYRWRKFNGISGGAPDAHA